MSKPKQEQGTSYPQQQPSATSALYPSQNMAQGPAPVAHPWAQTPPQMVQTQGFGQQPQAGVSPQSPWSQPAQGPFAPQKPVTTPQVATVVAPPPQAPQMVQTHRPALQDAPAADLDGEMALEVRLLWGDTVLDHAHFQDPKEITVGESRRNTFPLSSDALPPDRPTFTLVDATRGDIRVHFVKTMDGWIEHQGQTISLDQLRAMGMTEAATDGAGEVFVLPIKTRVFLRMGTLTCELGVVSAPKQTGIASSLQADNKLSRALGASFLIHGLVVLFMLFSDESPKTLNESFGKQGDRFTELIMRPQEPKEKIRQKKRSGGAKAPKKEGAMGNKHATNRNRRADQIKKNPDGTSPIDLRKSLNKKQLVNDIMRKGLMGLLPGGKMKQGSILDAKGLGGGDVNALGSWHGAKAGVAFGGGGLGRIGNGGPGGGGLDGNSVATGNPGLIGRGGGNGGRNWQKGKMKRKRQHKVKVTTGRMRTIGGLDRKIIRKHINMHRGRIKYCYEKELIKNKQLTGKIEVQFTIEPTGHVSQATVARTSMNNDRVEQCIVMRVKHIRFPPPTGGGIVMVRYPFMFRSGRN